MLGPRTSAIEGVLRYPLELHADERGDFVEVFRAQWIPDFQPVQWNLQASGHNVLRGFRCHVRHTDLLVVVSGSLLLGLADLRAGSPSEGVTETIELKPAAEAVLIPPGVGHGFYFPEPATVVQAVSHIWSIDDELGCRWDDPDLDIDWSCVDPVISNQDRNAGTLAELRQAIHARLAAPATGSRSDALISSR